LVESFRPYAHSEPLAKAIELLLVKLPAADSPVRTPRTPLPTRVRKLLASEVTHLIDAYQSGATLGQLAARFGISRNTVTKILTLARVPLRSPRLNAGQIDEAVRLYAVGQSLARIGDRFGVDAHTIRRRLLEREVTMRDSAGRFRRATPPADATGADQLKSKR
jgi:transposase-like protein